VAIIVPPFVQYQAPLVPLRGLWNSVPAEGDRFVQAEIDWGITTGAGNAVQFALSGNSPVAFSQIVALSVDNSRCGSDVDFLFPDSGFVLTVPAYNQGVYPIFSNALMFYVVAGSAAVSDTTIFQVLNSMPPPIAIQPSSEQSMTSVAGVSLSANASTPVVAAPTVGTIEGLQGNVSSASTTAGTCVVQLQDGRPLVLWETTVTVPAGSQTYQLVAISGLRLRFINGLNLVVSGTTAITSGGLNLNVYYAVP
jgi:hypothetical protein